MRLNIILIISLVIFSCGQNEEKNNSENQSSKKGSIQTYTIALNKGCNYNNELQQSKIYSFNSDSEAEDAIMEIMRKTGLNNNFIIKAADVDNACALIIDNERYIFYSQGFMQDVFKKTNSRYGALSIMAHEIGHHLNAHTFTEQEGNIRVQLELEADRFSGFVLAKLGASLEEAILAMKLYGSDKESKTHPAKKTRIAAITNGYLEGKEHLEEKVAEQQTVVNADTKYSIQVAVPPLAMRNRSLSPQDIREANSGSSKGRSLNKETIIADLPNGTPVEILSMVNNTFYIRAWLNNKEITGYVVKKFRGASTIK
jgi:hypothetical protein